jgi:hypothetical protein
MTCSIPLRASTTTALRVVLFRSASTNQHSDSITVREYLWSSVIPVALVLLTLISHFAQRPCFHAACFVCSNARGQYSGGQPSVGQGGFYGSGGARVLPLEDSDPHKQHEQQRSKMLALAQDVQTIRSTMSELEMLESLLRSEGTSNTSKRMELKNAIKKLMTAPQFNESLNNLEIRGEPAWGLSREERELIIAARGKVNEC